MMIKIIKLSKNLFKKYLIICFFILICPLFVYAENTSDKSLSLVLAVDSSGSMSKTDPGYLRKEAAKLFVNLLTTGDQVGIVEFSSDVKVLSPLKTITSVDEKEIIANRLDKLKTAGNTRIDMAVEEAINQFDTSDFSNKAIILLSDGALDVDGSPLSDKSKTAKNELLTKSLNQLKNKGIKVYSISLSDTSVDLNTKKLQEEVLETLSGSTGGYYSVSSNNVDLHKKFIDVLVQITDPPQLPYQIVDNEIQFYVDPKIKRVNVILNKKTQKNASVKLITPEGKPLNEPINGVVDWSKSGDVDIITLQEVHESGLWKISSDKDVSKFDIFIFADSAYKLSELKVQGKNEAYEKLTFSVNMMEKLSGKDDYKSVNLSDLKYILKIVDPDGAVSLIPMLYSKMKQNYSYYVPKKEGLYNFSAFTKGNVQRITPLKALKIIKPNLDEPRIMLDQSLYIIGETVKITVLNKNKDFKIPKKPIKFFSSDMSVLKEPKIKVKDNKVYALATINDNYEPGIYTVGYEYYDKDKLKTRNAFAYVLGKVLIDSNSIDFGSFSGNGDSESQLYIKSELDQTSIPLYLEINKVDINLKDLKPSDLRFNYSYEFFIKSDKKEIDLKMIIPTRLFNKVQGLFLPKNLEGTIVFKLYTRQKELLSEKTIPFKATILSKFQYNLNLILIIAGVMAVLAGLIIFLKKYKKPSSN